MVWTEGDELALRALKYYQDRATYGSIEAEQLNRLIKALEGRKEGS